MVPAVASPRLTALLSRAVRLACTMPSRDVAVSFNAAVRLQPPSSTSSWLDPGPHPSSPVAVVRKGQGDLRRGEPLTHRMVGEIARRVSNHPPSARAILQPVDLVSILKTLFELSRDTVITDPRASAPNGGAVHAWMGDVLVATRGICSEFTDRWLVRAVSPLSVATLAAMVHVSGRMARLAATWLDSPDVRIQRLAVDATCVIGAMIRATANHISRWSPADPGRRDDAGAAADQPTAVGEGGHASAPSSSLVPLTGQPLAVLINGLCLWHSAGAEIARRGVKLAIWCRASAAMKFDKLGGGGTGPCPIAELWDSTTSLLASAISPYVTAFLTEPLAHGSSRHREGGAAAEPNAATGDVSQRRERAAVIRGIVRIPPLWAVAHEPVLIVWTEDTVRDYGMMDTTASQPHDALSEEEHHCRAAHAADLLATMTTAMAENNAASPLSASLVRTNRSSSSPPSLTSHGAPSQWRRSFRETLLADTDFDFWEMLMMAALKGVLNGEPVANHHRRHHATDARVSSRLLIPVLHALTAIVPDAAMCEGAVAGDASIASDQGTVTHLVEKLIPVMRQFHAALGRAHHCYDCDGLARALANLGFRFEAIVARGGVGGEERIVSAAVNDLCHVYIDVVASVCGTVVVIAARERQNKSHRRTATNALLCSKALCGVTAALASVSRWTDANGLNEATGQQSLSAVAQRCLNGLRSICAPVMEPTHHPSRDHLTGNHADALMYGLLALFRLVQLGQRQTRVAEGVGALREPSPAMVQLRSEACDLAADIFRFSLTALVAQGKEGGGSGGAPPVWAENWIRMRPVSAICWWLARCPVGPVEPFAVALLLATDYRGGASRDLEGAFVLLAAVMAAGRRSRRVRDIGLSKLVPVLVDLAGPFRDFPKTDPFLAVSTSRLLACLRALSRVSQQAAWRRSDGKATTDLARLVIRSLSLR